MEKPSQAPQHLEIGRAHHGVLVLTNDSGDPGIAAARAHAGELASRSHVPVILYDRSEETWGDTQHPEGPLLPGDELLEGRTALTEQLEEVRVLGAQPLAWIATLPSITAVETALASTGADMVVVPETLDRKLLERALVGDSIASALRTRLSRHPGLEHVEVVEVAADGSTVSAS